MRKLLGILVIVAGCGQHRAPPPTVPAPKPIPVPSGPFTPVTSCGPATGDAFYDLPGALPRLSPETLGTIIRCENLGETSADELSRLGSWRASSRDPARFGLAHYRILYLSQGPIGTPAVVSATVYLPTGDGKCGGATAWPIVAVQHGTTGMADECAPSRHTMFIDYMAVPMVGRGRAVVATDYQGLGTPGVHPYHVGESAAYSVLDSVRALAQLRDPRIDPGCFGNDVVFMGHSQGGHATLFAEQYASTYGMGEHRKLRGALAWAPGFGMRSSAEGITVPPTTKNHAAVTFFAMFLYGHAHYYGAPPDEAWLAPQAVKVVPEIFEHECGLALLAGVPDKLPTLGDLFTQKFLDEEAACSPTAAECPGFEPWATYIKKSLPGQFATQIPTLLVQGNGDQIVPPVSTACVAARMSGHGDPVDVCAHDHLGHLEIVGSTWADTLPWIDAALAGATPARSSCGATLPVCPVP